MPFRSLPALLLAFNVVFAAAAQGQNAAAPVAGLRYDVEFVPGATYDPSVPTVESLIGFRAGERAARHAEIERCIQMWAAESERMAVTQYASTHEGRALYFIVLSSPENIANIDAIKRGMAKLADPRTLEGDEGERLTASLPAVAWLGYSIHGDETSGADAALALIYHLIASQDDDVAEMLDDMVIIIDPMMNPDGRERFLQQIAENRGVNPNLDDQAALHTGVWPEGRGNHYLFDLNRDWIYGVHPETRGRIRAVREWKPLLFVDAHEMGPQDTYLFSPPREPSNPYHPARRRAWGDLFARDQAAAFDRHGWRYYSGEWNDNWYPGFSDAWASLGGAIGILYEQAGIADAGIRRPEGTVMPYRRSVHQQFTSSLANLDTLRRHRRMLLNQFLLERTNNLNDPALASRVYAFVPTLNEGRMNDFLDLLELQGIEAHVTTSDVVVEGATDRLGRTIDRRELPRATVLIPAAQPESPLTRALFEFDPRMTDEFLLEERQELLRMGESRLYDMTAWNIPMMFDLEALTLKSGMPANTEPLVRQPAEAGGVERPQSQAGFVFTGHDDRAVALAARLLERDVQVRVAERDFAFDDIDYPRGSIIITHDDNRNYRGDLIKTLEEVCRSLNITAVGFDSGQSAGDLPDLGGWHFVLLNRPRVAILSRGETKRTTVGEVWHEIDQRLGIRATLLNIHTLSAFDLRRYNVIVVPDSWENDLNEPDIELLKDWTRAGGVLIVIGNAIPGFTRESASFSSVRELTDVLGDLDPYRLALAREWQGRTESIKTDSVWSHVVTESPSDPIASNPPIDEQDALERLDEWQSIFMPQGAMVAGRTDDRHWLTMGAGEILPVVFGRAPILMVGQGARAAIRLGAIVKSSTPEIESEDDGPAWAGWAPTPVGHELRLRMSGLLWPEAAHRIANAAWLTSESVGKGQVIFFATPPAFRGATRGAARLFHNAVVFGPGYAASHVIEP